MSARQAGENLHGKKFNLYAPIEHEHDLLIWIIEVRPEYRRKGIARALIKRAADYGKEMGSIQLRAWSSSDKTAAIPMWKALGFGLSPGQEHHEGKVIYGYHATRQIRKNHEDYTNRTTVTLMYIGKDPLCPLCPIRVISGLKRKAALADSLK